MLIATGVYSAKVTPVTYVNVGDHVNQWPWQCFQAVTWSRN
jgi:hypothetical protein